MTRATERAIREAHQQLDELRWGLESVASAQRQHERMDDARLDLLSRYISNDLPCPSDVLSDVAELIGEAIERLETLMD